MKWGIFEATEDRLAQVVPVDDEGCTSHFLYVNCTCAWWLDGNIVVHEHDEMLDATAEAQQES